MKNMKKYIDMNEFKVGQWVTNDQTNDTFIICKIDDAPISGTTYSEEMYYDKDYTTHITYHCRQASQEEIENECKKMIYE